MWSSELSDHLCFWQAISILVEIPAVSLAMLMCLERQWKKFQLLIPLPPMWVT